MLHPNRDMARTLLVVLEQRNPMVVHMSPKRMPQKLQNKNQGTVAHAALTKPLQKETPQSEPHPYTVDSTSKPRDLLIGSSFCRGPGGERASPRLPL